MLEMRTDGGDEYIGREFKNLLSLNKIKHEVSSPYTPSQNGTAKKELANWLRYGKMFC